MTASPFRRRFVVLISGRGSNMRAIVAAVRARSAVADVCAVISNEAGAAGLEWARCQGIETHTVSHREYASRDAFDQALARAIDRYDPHYVLLAGFMRILTEAFVTHYRGRLLNVHPSLLPAFPGLHTHQRALADGVQWHGCTVHFVTSALDQGPIVAQGAVPVLAGDTADTLAARVLHVEHFVYAQVVGWLAEDRVFLGERSPVRVEGVATRSFVSLEGAARQIDVAP